MQGSQGNPSPGQTLLRKLTRSFQLKPYLTRGFGMAAATAMMMSLAPQARAVSLINPGAGPATRQASDTLGIVTQVRHGGGGGHGGGGFHGGGGGGFRGGGMPAFHGGGFRPGPAFGGGYRRYVAPRYAAPHIARRAYYAPPISYGYRRHFRPRYYGYAPVYYGYYGPSYYQPRRFCRIVWTYYGPRKICRYRTWRHHHWHHRHWHHRRHHHRFHVYW